LKTFGEKYRELRHKNSLSLHDVGYLANLNRSQIARIETGKSLAPHSQAAIDRMIKGFDLTEKEKVDLYNTAYQEHFNRLMNSFWGLKPPKARGSFYLWKHIKK
jgi:transcriptional regulator with XRE-family HTH domain